MAMVSHMSFDHGTIFQSPIEFNFSNVFPFGFVQKNSPTKSSIDIHGFIIIYTQKAISINFISVHLPLITSFIKGYPIDEWILILVNQIQEEKWRSRLC